MGNRDRLARSAAPFLDPGEVVQQAFAARLVPRNTPWSREMVNVIGTQDAVLILRTGFLSTKPKQVLARVPKTEPISLEGGWPTRLRIGDHELRIAGKSKRAEVGQIVNT
jgi:hypothetical protein